MNNNGWSRALDTQMDQVKWQNSKLGKSFTVGFFEEILSKKPGRDGPGEREAAALELDHSVRTGLYRADTVYVTADMQHVLLQAAHDLPEDATFDSHKLITPNGFALFEETIYGTDRNDLTISVKAILWQAVRTRENPDHTGIIVYFFSDGRDLADDINKELIPYFDQQNIQIPPLAIIHYYPTFDGHKLPQPSLPGSELVCSVMKLFWAMQLLAQQRIGEPIRISPDRATRKRFQREYGDAPVPMITLITLRRKSVKHDDAPHPVEWSRRWVVRGHWRKQPDKNGWHWTYIYEYVKGPEDKPLVQTERRVFNFRR